MEQEFIVSARKYRPVTFDSVVGQSSVTNTLKNAVKTGKIAHAYLFCGPRGVGKTTCARIFARTLNCLNLTSDTEACNECESCRSFNESRSFNIHELDAASNNSVDDIRSLCDQVRIPPQIGRYSIYIIDEVHMLSPNAFNAFLKTLEEPPAHAIFILATTEKHKIIPTILSRCQIFDFKRIRVEDTVDYLARIAAAEGTRFEPEALNIIAQKSDGGMRDALSIFDQMVSFTGGNIQYKSVIESLHVLDYDYYFKLTACFLANRYGDALLIFSEILANGFDAHNFIVGLASHFRDLLVSRDVATLELLEVSPQVRDKYRQQSQQCGEAFLFDALSVCSACDIGYRASKNQRLHVELALLKLCSVRTTVVDTVASSGPLRQIPSSPPPSSAPSVKAPPAATTPPQMKSSPAMPSIKEAMSRPVPERSAPQPPAPDPQRAPSQPSDSIHGTDVAGDLVEMPLEAESLNAAWKVYAKKTEEKEPRLYSTLTFCDPVIVSNHGIEFHVLNSLQSEEVKQCRGAILSFLRKELQHPNLELTIVVRESSSPTKRYYTAADKLNHLMEKNPLMAELKQQLSLELE